MEFILNGSNKFCYVTAIDSTHRELTITIRIWLDVGYMCDPRMLNQYHQIILQTIHNSLNESVKT